MANKQSQKTQESIRHYFIDEGGDRTLFSQKGKVLIGTEGCSCFFILGLLDVPDPATLQRTFDDLRTHRQQRRRNIPVCKLLTISFGRYKDFMNAAKIGTWSIYGELLSSCTTLTIHARQIMVSITHKKSSLNAAALEWRQANKKPGI